MSSPSPARILCESLSIINLCPSLLSRVRAHGVLSWSAEYDGIHDLRSRLLTLQNFRCAYCQTPIFADQNGLRELDHILPKDASPHVKALTGYSSAFKHRYHTYGYEKFRFEPLNIVIACKQCNSIKTTFDPLFIRSFALTEYPKVETDFLWVHPYFHKYSAHVEISKNWTYRGKSYEGMTLIRICKLDKSEVLARRKMAAALAAHSSDLKHTLKKYSAHADDLVASDCVGALVDKFGMPDADAEALILAWFEYGAEVSEKLLEKALKLTRTVQAKLDRLNVNSP